VAVKKLFDDGGLSAGALAQFAVIAANPDGSRLARDGLSWTVSRIDRTWQWYLADGRWNYEATRTSRRVADGRINVGTGEPARLSIPADWGSYRLDISMGGAQTSVAYSVGHAGELTADAPDVLDVALDKDSYTNGEAMVLNIKPRFAGRATVAIIGDKVQTWREVDLPAGGTQVRLAAIADWGAGGAAHAGPGAGRGMVLCGPGGKSAAGDAGPAAANPPACQPRHSGDPGGPSGRRRGLRHDLGGGCRHPQPDTS
jgi:hypothetical protein